MVMGSAGSGRCRITRGKPRPSDRGGAGTSSSERDKTPCTERPTAVPAGVFVGLGFRRRFRSGPPTICLPSLIVANVYRLSGLRRSRTHVSVSSVQTDRSPGWGFFSDPLPRRGRHAQLHRVPVRGCGGADAGVHAARPESLGGPALALHDARLNEPLQPTRPASRRSAASMSHDRPDG